MILSLYFLKMSLTKYHIFEARDLQHPKPTSRSAVSCGRALVQLSYILQALHARCNTDFSILIEGDLTSHWTNLPFPGRRKVNGTIITHLANAKTKTPDIHVRVCKELT